MRLIDADALDAELNKAYEDIIMDEQREGFNIACSVIDKMSTVEPKHGEWINEDYGIGECFAECSECGEETNGNAKDTGFGYDYSFPNFCPNCGARMKEGDEK